MEPAEDRYALDPADWLRWPWERLPLGEALVRACLIVELHERGDEAPQVVLVEDKDVIEEFASQRADEPFGKGVHVGCVDRGAYDLRVDAGEDTGEPGAELRIVVANEHLRSSPIERCVACLLRAPGVRRRVRHGGVNNRTIPHVEKEEYEDLAKPRVVGLYEVGRPRDVIAQERRPSLAIAGWTRALHVLLDRPLADADAELEQFASDAFGAPQRVARGHLPDERGSGRWRSPRSISIGTARTHEVQRGAIEGL